ncbi:Ig-like domain-containing protein, partial [Brevibacillus daliensis]|uniref:Ig-like domain-containing protein n=1 Tax=Brevibacillus daliensis TaxID=2892995 RepID=UPI001E604628
MSHSSFSHQLPHHDYGIRVVLSANTSSVTIGSIITYTVQVFNDNDGILTDATLVIPAPPDTTFVPNSVTINGFPQLEASPLIGINIGAIPQAVDFISVSYQFQVVSTLDPELIKSQATLSGTLLWNGITIPVSVLSNELISPFPGVSIPLYGTNNGIIVPEGKIVKSYVKIANPGGNPLLYELLSQPSHGRIILVSDGRYIYKPQKGFRGEDLFTVLAIDPVCSSSAIVRVVVAVESKCHKPRHSSSSSSSSSSPCSSSSSSSSCFSSDSSSSSSC